MRFWIAIFIGCACFCSAYGQDIQYSQYYANPLYLNPAFTGAISHHRVAINHRIQWPSLPKAYTNYSASYDYHAGSLNSGFGLILNADRAGSANLQNTSATFNYSYTMGFNNELIIKPALSFGYVNRTIDNSKLFFGDQIDFGIAGAPTQDPSVGAIEPTSYLDIGTGILIYDKALWGGFSAFHVNQPSNSIIDGESYVPIKFSVHAGARIRMGNDAFKDIKKVSIAPSFVYKRQGDFQQLDLGTSFHYAPILVGFWYRGIPFLKSAAPKVINHDAVVFVLGVEFDDFHFGYSYDANISRLRSDTGGVHEFSLQYFFDIHFAHKGATRAQKILHCPAFNK